MTPKEQQQAESAFLAGFESALRAYAVWRDGVQWVGVRERAVKEVLAEVEAGEHECYRLDLRAYLSKLREEEESKRSQAACPACMCPDITKQHRQDCPRA